MKLDIKAMFIALSSTTIIALPVLMLYVWATITINNISIQEGLICGGLTWGGGMIMGVIAMVLNS